MYESSVIKSVRRRKVALERDVAEYRERLTVMSDNEYNRWGKVVESKLTSLENRLEAETWWYERLVAKIA